MATPFLLFFPILLVCGNVASFSLVIRLNEPDSDTSHYLCSDTATENAVFDTRMKLVLVDVRDLNNEVLSVDQMQEVVRNRISRIGKDLPIALFINEDRTGKYVLAGDHSVFVTIVVSNRVATSIPSHELESRSFVAFVQTKAVEDFLKTRLNNSLSGWIIAFTVPEPVPFGFRILAFLILKSLSLSSIIIAGLIVHRIQREVVLVERSTQLWVQVTYITTLLLCSICVLVLAYFFYNVMVQFFIAAFVVGGASAMSYLSALVLFRVFSRLKSASVTICKQPINLVKIGLFFFFLGFTLTWYFFRNHYLIGFIMQDIIGVFLIIQILVDIAPMSSFKGISVVFLLFVIYDVFFVFISPFFLGSSSVITSPALELTNVTESLSRLRRSLPATSDSIMEAVATGSAGSSGEKMPVVFKVSASVLGNVLDVCSLNRDYAILGFGDAVVPGCLCVFLAYYDACYKRKVWWNFLASLLGYILGGMVVFGVLFASKMAQPALLCLCPFTWGTVVLCAALRGGRSELVNLYNSNFPRLLTASKSTGNAEGKNLPDIVGYQNHLSTTSALSDSDTETVIWGGDSQNRNLNSPTIDISDRSNSPGKGSINPHV